MIRIPGLALRTPRVGHLVSVLLVGAACSIAHAQGLPQDVKTSNNPQQIRPAVQDFMTKQLTALAGADAAEQTKARNSLVAESVLMQGQANAATAVYTDVYAQELSQRLEAIAKDAKATTRTRLNGAVVLAQVAQQTSNPQLRTATLALLGDSSEAVVIWALKAARPLLPVVLKALPPDMRLHPAIVQAAKRFPKGTAGGAIIMEAYNALALDIADPTKAKTLTPAMHKAVIPSMLELLQFRISQYQAGIPAEVRAERIPTFYLTDAGVWNAMTEPQRLQAVQSMAHLLILAAAQAQGGQVPQEDRKELAAMIGAASRSMSRAATTAGATDIAQALVPATQLGEGEVARQATGKDIQTRVAGILPALQANAKFKGIQPPPAIVGHEQAPPPASAPTTGPVEIPGAGPAPPPAPKPAPAPPTPPPTAPSGPGARPPPGSAGRPPPNTPPPGARPTPTPPPGGPRPTTAPPPANNPPPRQ